MIFTSKVHENKITMYTGIKKHWINWLSIPGNHYLSPFTPWKGLQSTAGHTFTIHSYNHTWEQLRVSNRHKLVCFGALKINQSMAHNTEPSCDDVAELTNQPSSCCQPKYWHWRKQKPNGKLKRGKQEGKSGKNKQEKWKMTRQDKKSNYLRIPPNRKQTN